MNGFGELLAELRQDHKLTQQQLADILHVSVGTISNYENGVHLPDIEKLINLADFFHVTTDYLLGRCSSNLSLDVFQEPLTESKTLGKFVQTLRQLPMDRKRALILIASDMEFHVHVTVGLNEKSEEQ